MKKTLKIGIAPREVIARYTRDVVAGRRPRTSEDPDIWFTSLDSCAKVMSERVSGGGTVKTVILDVRDPGEAMTDFRRVWKAGKRERFARISFASPELLWKVLTAKRWELLKGAVWSRTHFHPRGRAAGGPRRQGGPQRYHGTPQCWHP